MTTKKLIQAAAGSAGGSKVYVEDVFSTDLYVGNGSNGLAIDNGIDLAGEGGLVWIKDRALENHSLATTEQGLQYQLASNLSNGNISWGNMQSYDSDGFTLTNAGTTNTSTNEYVSWTFRKQPGFFDVKEVTKSSGSNLVVDFSNLGSLGFVAAKPTTSQDWICWCKGMTSTHHLKFNSTDASSSGNYMTVSGTSVTLIDGAYASGGSIIYAWADGDDSSAQIFGDDEDEAIIKCGSYTGSGAVGKTITLGFEPQWMLVKNASATTPWVMIDNMRGMPVDGEGVRLLANEDAAEVSSASYFAPRADGAEVTLQNTYVNTSGETYIYIAIRRGPMKGPSAATDVYTPVRPSSSGTFTAVSGFPTDLTINKGPSNGDTTYLGTRLTGVNSLTPSSTAAESSVSFAFDFMNQITIGGSGDYSAWISWNFRRYPKVFDVVIYKGNGSPSVGERNGLKHNLGVAPEMIIHKRIDATSEWQVGATPTATGGYLNLTNSFATSFTPANEFTATTFDVSGWIGEWNNNVVNSSYVCYLFATLAGVSKVGSYSGTGSDVNVDCGFSGGARFVLLKRTDSPNTGDWYVFDTVTGIATGNEAYNFMNSNTGVQSAADYIDPLASGFTVTSSAPAALNASGGTYLFLAFA